MSCFAEPQWPPKRRRSWLSQIDWVNSAAAAGQGFRAKGLNTQREAAILEPLIDTQANGNIHDTSALELE